MYKGIRFKGYKAFTADTYTELDNLPRVSVIIGKNNSGKSSVIDVVGMMYDRMYTFREQIASCADEIIAEIPVTREMCDSLLRGYSSIQVCITKISTFLILCDLAVCLATLYVSFSLVFALMRYLQGKVFLIRFYSPTTLSSSRAEFRLPSRLACA